MELEHGDFGRGAGQGPPRPPLRPLVGIPVPEGARERTWRSTVLSVTLHLLVLALILVPPLVASRVLEPVQGAGGEGPAGGGGGGTGGSGGVDRPVEERLRYIQVAPTPPAPSPTATEPEVPPPVEEEKPEEPVPPPVSVNVDVPKTNIDVSVVSGTGGGSGTDGTAGSGPGTGGGVGSGVGTGRGSSTGPGTGGGPGTIYPPTPIDMAIPPMPQPQKVKGKTIVAVFEVDERGNVIDFEFTSSGDRGYDRRMRDILGEYRFRPATTWEGKPVRAKASVEFDL